MSSLWDKNGVDWENIRKYRTSYIIRELYQACYELYSEAWNMTRLSNSIVRPIPENNTFIERDEFALRDVYSMLLRMFSESPDYSTIGTGNSRQSGYVATGCFVDDLYTPSGLPSMEYNELFADVMYTEFIGGLEYMTLSKFEEYYGDMSFIRDLGVNYRITHVELFKLYKILTHPIKLNPFTCKPAIQSMTGDFLGVWFRFSDSDFGFTTSSYREEGEDDLSTGTPQEYVDSMKNLDVYETGFDVGGGTQLTLASKTLDIRHLNGSGLAKNSARPHNFVSFSRENRGIPLQPLSEFDIDTVNYSAVKEDDFNIFSTQNPYPTGFERKSEVEFTQRTSFQFPLESGSTYESYSIDDADLITSGLDNIPSVPAGEQYRTLIEMDSIPLINIRDRNFAKYYTEEAN